MKWRRFWHILLVSSFVLWLFAVLTGFYVVQKPFGPEMARSALRVTLDMATAILVTALAAALGRRILTQLGPQDLPPGDLIWLAPGLGLGALALVNFGLGLVGGWYRSTVCGLVAVSVGLLARDMVALARQMRHWRPRPALGKWGRRYLMLTLALTFVLALAPPTSWDGLFYHLTGPALYIDQSAITPLDINIPHLAFPSLMEMLFSLAMLLRSDVAAKLLHVVYVLLLTAVVYRLSRRWQGREVARWSVLLLVSTPMVSVLAGWAYNDLALAFYQLASLYALLAWQESKASNWLVVAGLLTGLALGLKYTAFLLPLIGLVYVLWRARDRWRAAAVFTVVTGLVAVPWYARNWAFTGNPVYPFVFNGRNWDAFRSAWYAHAGTGIGWHPLKILALPATMTLGLHDVNYYDGRMGPLFLALSPALMLLIVRAWRVRPGLWASNGKGQVFVLLGGFAFVCAVTWTLGVIQSRALFQARLFLPGLVALIPLLAESLVQLVALDRPRFSLSAFVTLTVSTVLALALISQALWVLRFDPFGYLVGYESRSEYLRRVLGDHYRAMEELEAIVPEHGQVLFLWEPRSYYSPKHTQPDAILDNWAHLQHRYITADEIAAHLDEEGYTHVLLNERGLNFVLENEESPLSYEEAQQLQVFLKTYLSLVGEEGSYRIYELDGQTMTEHERQANKLSSG